MPVIFICDNPACGKVGTGRWVPDVRWTPPKEWVSADGVWLSHVTCSAACEQRWKEQRGLFEGKQEG